MKIYVPNLENYKCVVVNSDSTLRAYKEIPRNNINVNYIDYYFTANYLYKEGTQNFTQYSTLPTCLPNDNLTSNYIYRNDFPDILIMFFIISIFVVYIPYRIFSRFFGRWLKW